MFNIDVNRVDPYLEVEVSIDDVTMESGLLDEEEAVEQAKKLISAAEKLLPAGYGDAEFKLSKIREGL